MQSKVVAVMVAEHGLGATMLVRRANGQFVFERIDARVASASRLAADWSMRSGAPGAVSPRAR